MSHERSDARTQNSMYGTLIQKSQVTAEFLVMAQVTAAYSFQG